MNEQLICPTILHEDQMPILRPLPMPDGAPHREWRVLEHWQLYCVPLNITFHIPKDFIFNGASVPRIFSNIFPATGYLFIAALIHDYLYEHASYIRLFEHTDNQITFTVVSVTRGESDEIFKEISNWLYKDNWFKTSLAKGALVIGGQGAWDTCRKLDGTYIPPAPYKYEDDEEDWLK